MRTLYSADKGSGSIVSAKALAAPRGNSHALPSLLRFPGVDDIEAGRLERCDIAYGDGETASGCNGGDVAVWLEEAPAGGPGLNGQLGVVPCCVGVERKHAIFEYAAGSA